MKLIICVIFGFILSSFIVSSIAFDIAEKLKKVDEDGYKTKITDLDADCLLLVFENFDFNNLLNVAQVNEKFSSLAADTFRRKYSRWLIVVNDNILLPKNPKELSDVVGMNFHSSEIEHINFVYFNPWELEIHRVKPNKKTSISNGHIHLEHGDVIMNVFKHFGHVIKKLQVEAGSRFYRWQKHAFIGKLISRYCSKSLVEMDIGCDSESVLKHITEPMIKIQVVTFRSNRQSLSSKTIMNEMFPNVRRLVLSYSEREFLDYFDQYMPHLEHVELFGGMFGCADDPGLFAKNSQIKRVTLSLHSGWEFILKLNALLPQLETLSLSKFGRDTNVQFENVTTLAIGDYDYDTHSTSIANLHFPRLQFLRLNYVLRYDGAFDGYLTFFNGHNHLNHLHLKLRYYEMNDAAFEQLTENLTELVELTLEHDDRNSKTYGNTNLISPNTILEFLRGHNKIERFNFIGDRTYWKDELKNLLKDEWNLRTTQAGLSFERR